MEIDQGNGGEQLSPKEVEELILPLLKWRGEEESKTGAISRTSHTPQRVADWKYYSLGAHGIVFVDDNRGMACKLLYNPNKDKDIEIRYEKLRNILPLATLLLADKGCIVTEFQYGDTVNDPILAAKYRQIAEDNGMQLDKGIGNIVNNENGEPRIIDW